MSDLVAVDQLEILKGALVELAWLKALVEPEKTPVVMPLAAAPLPRERSARSVDGRPPSKSTEYVVPTQHDYMLPPGTYVFTLWLSVLCMRSKAWLAARVSLRLARLPQCSALTSPSLHARGCTSPSRAR